MPAPRTSAFVYTNGIRMHYVEEGEGPLVLLCHGWPESWYAWRHQILVLANAGFRVVVPDQRGYGFTDAPTDIAAYDIMNLTGDLVGLVNALGEEHAILMGHDWGSMVAATAALLRPDMFQALVLLSVPYMPRRRIRPSAQFHMNTQERHFYQDYFQQPGRVERELERDIRRALLGILYSGSGDCRAHPEHRRSSFLSFNKDTQFIDNLIVPETLPAWLGEADLDFFDAQFRHSGFRGPINWYRNLDRNWESTPFLDGAKILQPTMYIAGALDGVLKMAASEYETLQISVPNLVSKHLIPGAGHWIQQERPAEVSGLILSFLSDPQVSHRFA